MTHSTFVLSAILWLGLIVPSGAARSQEANTKFLLQNISNPNETIIFPNDFLPPKAKIIIQLSSGCTACVKSALENYQNAKRVLKRDIQMVFAVNAISWPVARTELTKNISTPELKDFYHDPGKRFAKKFGANEDITIFAFLGDKVVAREFAKPESTKTALARTLNSLEAKMRTN